MRNSSPTISPTPTLASSHRIGMQSIRLFRHDFSGFCSNRPGLLSSSGAPGRPMCRRASKDLDIWGRGVWVGIGDSDLYCCDCPSQGEDQKKLDVLSNELFVKALISGGRTVWVLKSILRHDDFVSPLPDPDSICFAVHSGVGRGWRGHFCGSTAAGKVCCCLRFALIERSSSNIDWRRLHWNGTTP